MTSSHLECNYLSDSLSQPDAKHPPPSARSQLSNQQSSPKFPEGVLGQILSFHPHGGSSWHTTTYRGEIPIGTDEEARAALLGDGQ